MVLNYYILFIRVAFFLIFVLWDFFSMATLLPSLDQDLPCQGK